MTEYLIFQLIVPISTPDINHTSEVYRQIVQAKKDDAEEVMVNQLPEDWEYEYMGKIPE